MSGLAALFHRDGRSIDVTAIWAMLDAVPYRGPDGLGVRTFPAVGLGQAWMNMTPEDGSDQLPLLSARSGGAIVSDARLDNRDELRARLPSSPPPTASDRELILCAYETWGVAAPRHLLGDFAFVVWDPRRRRLVCARDPSGQRSLFYRVDATTFAAGSEIHQLLRDPGVPVAPNEERIREFLVPLNMFRNEKDQPTTFYRGILSVPAGHVLVVDPETVRMWRYWELQPPRELRYRTDDEYADHFRALFFDVVAPRLRSSHPVGALLSGGLDSSSVVCAAQELYRAGQAVDRGFTSFSFVYDGLECDEQAYIQDVQAKYGFAWRPISCGEFGGRLELKPRGFREAPNLGIPEARAAVFAAASETGVRALLTGHTADACLGGSRYVFDSLLRKANLPALWRHLRAYRRASTESLSRILLLYCARPLLPLGLQKQILCAYIARTLPTFQRELVPSWMPEPLRHELCRRHLDLCLAEERGRRFSSPAREVDYRLLYPPQVVRHPAPWSVELWDPFADRRLHEFLLAIPPEQKFEPHRETDAFYAGSKRLLRRGLRGILPDSVRTRRSKTMFGAVYQSEIDRQWPIYETAFGPSARPEVATRGYVDQALFWARLQSARGAMRGEDMVYVMQVVGLETWLRALSQPRAQLSSVLPVQEAAAGRLRSATIA